MTERVCKHCGGALPTAHGNRRYCSDNCRKRAFEGAPENRARCVDCGALGWRGDRCRPCFQKHAHERHEALLTRIADLYNAGVPLREITLSLGRKVTGSGAPGIGRELAELREDGRIGYRYKGCEDRVKAA